MRCEGKVRLALVGAGGNGEAFLRLYKEEPRCEVAVVCDVDEGRARAAAERYGVPDWTTDYREAVGGDVDAVSIHTPDRTHAEIAVAAFEAGKHVYCEKPLATTVEDVRRMVEAAERSGKVNFVGQVLRFNPFFAKVREMVKEGVIGEPVYVECDWLGDLRRWRAHPARSYSEPIVGAGVHAVDLVRWVVGEPVRAFAMATPRGWEDLPFPATYAAVYELEGGALAKTAASFVAVGGHGFAYNLQVRGTKGAIVRDQFWLRGWRAPATLPFRDEYRIPFEEEVRHFLDCITEGREPLVTFRDGGQSALCCIAAVESARRGEPVEVPRLD